MAPSHWHGSSILVANACDMPSTLYFPVGVEPMIGGRLFVYVEDPAAVYASGMTAGYILHRGSDYRVPIMFRPDGLPHMDWLPCRLSYLSSGLCQISDNNRLWWSGSYHSLCDYSRFAIDLNTFINV